MKKICIYIITNSTKLDLSPREKSVMFFKKYSSKTKEQELFGHLRSRMRIRSPEVSASIYPDSYLLTCESGNPGRAKSSVPAVDQQFEFTQ